MKFKIVIENSDFLSNVTRKVIGDFNTMMDTEFMHKYACTKTRYLKRVMKYGDPYMKAPLAKLGKWILRHKK